MEDKINSNISYTNKDFNSIYKELLDLVKTLSNKWDPSMSNESDPGVLLLKLNALIADKNNYNIDKNVLECFPASVTQEGNARKLYDSLGYKMHWYRSADTTIGFQLRTKENLYPNQLYSIPALTMLTDSTGSYIYTTIEDANIVTTESNYQTVRYVKAIEGTVYPYEINGNPDITISNLDENYRLYFTETNIAENGIFIKDSNSSNYDWQQVDNLTSYPLGNKVFEFGVLPNSNICYIQFPQDITDLLNNTAVFNIQYIISSGLDGNIKSNVLSKFLNNLEWVDKNASKTVVNDSIKIIQNIAATGGQDPEKIDEAYTNYKKTIGTFNTLVTAHDYENFAFNAQVQNSYLLSNCVVADRTSDLNVSNMVKTWNSDYENQQLIISKNAAGQPDLSAFNIVLYGLKNSSIYEENFEPNDDIYTLSILEDLISEIKALNSDFIDQSQFTTLYDSILYLFKNLMSLKGQVLTYSKVTQVEAEEIEENIKKAMEQNFVSRKLTFGEGLGYDEIISVIQNADSRIKAVVLDAPTYQVTQVSKSGANGEIGTAVLPPLEKLRLVARMILSGNVQLYSFDEDFNFEFGMSDIKKYSGTNDAPIKAITTQAEITIENNNTTGKPKPYTLNPHEVIQFYAPNLISLQQYSSYVYYNLLVANDNISIQPNQDIYIDGLNLKLFVQYTDTNNVIQTKDLSNQIVNFSFVPVIQDTEKFTTFDTSSFVTDYKKQLNSSQTITVKGLNQTRLENGTKYYLITNRNLSLSAKERTGYSKTFILENNEYLYYTNNKTTELVTLGSGIQLSLEGDDNTTLIIQNSTQTLDEISNSIENNKSDEINWYQLNLVGDSAKLVITELNIVSIGTDTVLKLDNTQPNSNKSVINNNEWELEGGFTVTDLNGEDIVYNAIPNIVLDKGELYNWKVRSRLNLETSAASPQVLYTGHSIELIYDTDQSESETISVNASGLTYIVFNTPIVSSGGVNIDIKVINIDDNSEQALYAYTYRNSPDGMFKPMQNKVPNVTRDLSNSIYLSSKNEGLANFTYNDSEYKYCVFNYVWTEDVQWLLPLKLTILAEGSEISIYKLTSDLTASNIESLIKANTTDAQWEKCRIFNKATNNEATFNLSNISTDGSYVLDLSDMASEGHPAKKFYNLLIVFKDCTSSEGLTIGKITKSNGYNTSEINVTDAMYSYDNFNIEDTIDNPNGGGTLKIENVISEILDVSTPYVSFDYTYRVPNSKKVLQPTLSSSYFNKYHLYNRYTIPMVLLNDAKTSSGDIFKASSIKVNAASIV